MVIDQGLIGKRLSLATCGRLWCLCFNVQNRFRLMAEFSAHRASVASDTDVSKGEGPGPCCLCLVQILVLILYHQSVN